MSEEMAVAPEYLCSLARAAAASSSSLPKNWSLLIDLLLENRSRASYDSPILLEVILDEPPVDELVGLPE
jgi:hypothetical protein